MSTTGFIHRTQGVHPLPNASATDLTGQEGRLVNLGPSGITITDAGEETPIGIIIEGGTEQSSVATWAFAGAVHLVLTSHDGTAPADAQMVAPLHTSADGGVTAASTGSAPIAIALHPAATGQRIAALLLPSAPSLS